MPEYVHILDSCIFHTSRIELWKVAGIDKKLFISKLTAEIAARRYFPDDDPDQRYARIFSVGYVSENDYE